MTNFNKIGTQLVLGISLTYDSVSLLWLYTLYYLYMTL